MPLASPWSACAPTAVLKFALPFPLRSLFSSARSPTAVFAAPITLVKSAESPMALLLNPVVLLKSENAPTASLNDPSNSLGPPVLNTSASVPTAVFRVPLTTPVFEPTFSNSAAAPTAVLESALLRISDGPMAVLKLPTVLKNSDRQPNAEFLAPVLNHGAITLEGAEVVV